MQEDFLQETQGHNNALLAMLTAPAGVQRLLYYVSVPQHVSSEDRAFRLPHFAAEALCCRVEALADALTTSDALLSLFSFLVPRLRELRSGGDFGEAALSAGEARTAADAAPHAASLWAKVVRRVVVARPATLCVFLRSAKASGIASALALRVADSTLADLATTLLSVPFAFDDSPAGPAGASRGGDWRAVLRLSTADPVGFPSALISVIEDALVAVEDGSVAAAAAASARADAAAGAASVLCRALSAARAHAPAAKFSAPGFRKTPAASDGSRDAVPTVAAALNAANLELDNLFIAQLSSVHMSPTSDLAPAPCVRLLHEVRDGESAVRIVRAAQRALALCSEGGASEASKTSARAALSVLEAAFSAAGEGWAHISRADRGEFTAMGIAGGSGSSDSFTSSGDGDPAPPRLISAAACALPCPRLIAVAATEGVIRALADAVRGAHGSFSPDPDAPPAPPPSAPGAVSLPMWVLASVRVLCAATRCGWDGMSTALADAAVFSALLRVSWAFPWHSILSRCVALALTDTLEGGVSAAIDALVVDAALPAELAHAGVRAGLRTSLTAPHTPARAGYGGHVVNLANVLATAALPPRSRAARDACPAFRRESSSRFAVANILNALLTGGKLAPDSRASGQVGKNADATAATPRAPAADDDVMVADGSRDASRAKAGARGSLRDHHARKNNAIDTATQAQAAAPAAAPPRPASQSDMGMWESSGVDGSEWGAQTGDFERRDAALISEIERSRESVGVYDDSAFESAFGSGGNDGGAFFGEFLDDDAGGAGEAVGLPRFSALAVTSTADDDAFAAASAEFAQDLADVSASTPTPSAPSLRGASWGGAADEFTVEGVTDTFAADFDTAGAVFNFTAAPEGPVLATEKVDAANNDWANW